MSRRSEQFPFTCFPATNVASGSYTGPPPIGAAQSLPSGYKAPNSGRRLTGNLDDRPIRVDRDAADQARLVSVPLKGWEQQKAKRVEEAYHRIVEREWFDKFEANLKQVEQVHINAVREHFAMRRDKIKTPDVRCRRGSNAIGREEWARNVEALNSLTTDTNVGTFFRGLAGKQKAARLKRAASSAETGTAATPAAAGNAAEL